MKWICWYRGRGVLWFRMFGAGFHACDHRIHAKSFSERYGVGCRRVHIGNWCFSFLRKVGR